MQIKITTWTGLRSDGMLLAVSGPTMRAAIPGADDAVEFCFRGGQWFSQEGEPVEIEVYPATVVDDSVDDPISQPWQAAHPSTPDAPGWVN